MIEDRVSRGAFAGRDPFQIESLWRESYGSGFSLRPDLSLIGVMSGLEMACWDIIGKAVEQPIYNLLGGKVHERLRSYTYLYPAAGEGEEFYRDADRSAARAAEYVKQGFTGSNSIPPAASRLTIRGSPRRKRSSEPCAWCAWCAKRSGRRADLLVGTHGQFTTSGAIRLAKQLEPYDPAVVRGAGAARDAGADGDGRARHQHSDRHRRAPDHQVRVRARLGSGRGEYHPDESGAGRRLARGKKSSGARRSALRADRAASCIAVRWWAPPTSRSPPARRIF
jgi:hypothetical protein